MKLIITALLFFQLGPRAPLTPAETLLAPELLRTIERASLEGAPVRVIQGSEPGAGEIAVVCGENCEPAESALRRLSTSIAAKQIPQPARTIRIVTVEGPRQNTKAAIFIAAGKGKTLQVVRGLWSTASIADEVIDVFARQAVGVVDARAFEYVGQPRWEATGVPITAIVPPQDATGADRASFIAAASAYFLATLPNAGSEALLSHLTVGAHARLAEDGRKAVAQMGSQQRASGDVLTTFAHAIDREQRRIRSFERFMPTPVDPMLHGRIVDMESGVAGIWTSMALTPAPYVPPAERIRGRGGEDRRVPSRTGPGGMPHLDLPTAFLKFENVDIVVYELGNFTDGKRSISDIRDAVSAEFLPIALPVVTEYFDRLAKAGAISIR